MKHRGFTLIELLIALAVFAVIAGMTSSVMYYAFNNKKRVAIQAERLSSLEIAAALLNHDFRQAVDREIRANEQLVFAAFIGDKQKVELTADGFSNPGSFEKRSHLKRVAYLCQNNQLLRRIWKKLDTANRDDYIEMKLLDNLQGCEFLYLNKDLQKQSEWRPFDPLPKAVLLNLKLKDWGEMNYLFLITGSQNAP